MELPTSEFTVLLYTCISLLSRSNAIAGETSLDRLANALGGKSVLPHIISSIPGMLQSGVYDILYVRTCNAIEINCGLVKVNVSKN